MLDNQCEHCGRFSGELYCHDLPSFYPTEPREEYVCKRCFELLEREEAEA